MEERLIAPCGMNCGVCVSYLAMTNDLKKKGFGKKYCAGCLPRGKNCTFMAKQCDLLGKGLVRFCFECSDYPCRRLKALNKRYSSKYHMSMIENLNFIKAHGIGSFLDKEATKWQCPECGGVICCHNGLCFNCSLDKLRQNKNAAGGNNEENKAREKKETTLPKVRNQRKDSPATTLFHNMGAEIDDNVILIDSTAKNAWSSTTRESSINKPVGVHVLFRHTPASLMVKNGCDLLTIQQVTRHNHITMAMHYLLLADDTKRYKYDKS